MIFELAALFLFSASPGAETASLDLNRYTGIWYEVARFDHFFERGCAGVTATYFRREDGTLRVVNRCLKGGLTGEEKTIEGKAWVPEASEPGKLKVQFFWPFRSDYWVLEVDAEYQWALVGDPTKSTCWILSRTPNPGEELLQLLRGKLKARGYAVEKLLRVEQPPG